MRKDYRKLLLHKKFFYFIIISPLVFILYACPYSSAYKLDEEATTPIDESIIGKWATLVRNNFGKPEPVKMILSKKNDTEYFIDFIGTFKELFPYQVSKTDSIKGFAYLSIIDNKQFLSIEVKNRTYITALIYKDEKLSILPLADGFTAKYIKSNAELRQAVEFHVKSRPFPYFEDQFSLKEMVRVN